MSAALLARWRVLAGADADQLGADLIAAYGESHRRYHGHGHLSWLLDEAARRAPLIAEPALVGYAIWFHDAVYDPLRPDNEQRSAAWARRALAASVGCSAAFVERVAVLVEKTKQHAEGAATPDEALFLDMDIAILGAPWELFCTYAAGIREEYGHVATPAFAAGRAAFLENQLAHARTFRTDVYERELGDKARANMRWEMEEMRKGRMVKA